MRLAFRQSKIIERIEHELEALHSLFHVRQDAPRMLFISGDRDLELLGRYEETAYFCRKMREIGHPSTQLYELDGFNHSQMAEPAHPLLLRFRAQ